MNIGIMDVDESVVNDYVLDLYSLGPSRPIENAIFCQGLKLFPRLATRDSIHSLYHHCLAP